MLRRVQGLGSTLRCGRRPIRLTPASLVTVLFLLLPVLGRADSIKLTDGKILRGETKLAPGVISITDTNGQPASLSLSNIDTVIFADGDEVIPGEQSLNSPWTGQDVGSVSAGGGARQQSNSFTIRCSGTGIEKENDSFHFVYLPMTGDAEIVAKLEQLASNAGHAQAALMIRQTLGPESAHAAVIVNQNDVPTFQYRVSRKRPAPPFRGQKI